MFYNPIGTYGYGSMFPTGGQINMTNQQSTGSGTQTVTNSNSIVSNGGWSYPSYGYPSYGFSGFGTGYPGSGFGYPGLGSGFGSGYGTGFGYSPCQSAWYGGCYNGCHRPGFFSRLLRGIF